MSSVDDIKQFSEQSLSQQEKERYIKLFVNILESKTREFTEKAEKYSKELSTKDAYIYVLEDANKALNSALSQTNEALARIENSKTYKLLCRLRTIVDFFKGGAKDSSLNQNSIQQIKINEENIETVTVNMMDLDNCSTEHVPDFIKQFYALAGYQEEPMVNALTVRFFELDGSHFFGGGAERYLLDMKEICDELGVGFRLYQYASYKWVRFVGTVEVVGLCPLKNDVNLINSELMNEMDALFDARTGKSTLVNVYSAFNLHVKKSDTNAVGISHGVFWDNPGEHFVNDSFFWKTHSELIESAKLCNKIISVDTNTCNWFQTINYDLGRIIHYIPNYVDTSIFYPRDGYLKIKQKTVITFPRRLYAPRGLYAVLDIIDDILFRYKDVEFHFVGRGYEEDTKQVQKKMELWPDRVKWYCKMPEEMFEVYQASDIVLIPTMYSEGTSLSCLEALASGNAVIATRVGGLTDLIINDYNGLLVEPNCISIYKAIVELLENPQKLVDLKENGRKTALSFSKLKWKQRIKNELSEYLKYDCGKKNNLMRVRINLKDDGLRNPIVQDYISSCLKAGWYVFISCSDEMLKQYSYQRIQFINSDEDLYFEFEKIISEEEIIRKSTTNDSEI